MEQSIIVGLHDTNLLFFPLFKFKEFTQQIHIFHRKRTTNYTLGMERYMKKKIGKRKNNTRFSFKYRTGVQSSIKIENFVELKKEVYTTQQKSFR